MEYAHPDDLVGVEWLAGHLDDPDIRVIDATYHLPVSERDAAEEFEFRHIPGAVFFDVDAICDTSTDLPHMLPSPEAFAQAVGGLGIANHHRLVIYDGSGGFLAAARVWWMFRVFGHERVAVLDGGLPHWGKKKLPLESGLASPAPATYRAAFDAGRVRNIEDMLANIESGAELVVDARGAGRFMGRDWEPRPSRKLGHIPGSINLPFSELMQPRKDYTYRSADEIAAAFQAAGVTGDKPIIATCGSGLTAAVIAFAAHLLGRKEVAIYDGSWAEWGNDDRTPVEFQ